MDEQHERFIYFFLYVQHKGQGSEGHVGQRWPAWISHIKRQVRAVMHFPDALGGETPLKVPQVLSEVGREAQRGSAQGGAKVLFRRIALLLGCLHLTLMAALGIWLWSAPQTFGTSSDSTCYIQYAWLAILGGQVRFGSNALHIISAVYNTFLLPGLKPAPPDGDVSQSLPLLGLRPVLNRESLY
ncbi:hypothetical protein NMY22_g5319 [Coprinellus aureogranulatus]|nr:hypothetical protein NMY22_g5319 [Coprinellus aureogranulatus]